MDCPSSTFHTPRPFSFCCPPAVCFQHEMCHSALRRFWVLLVVFCEKFSNLLLEFTADLPVHLTPPVPARQPGRFLRPFIFPQSVCLSVSSTLFSLPASHRSERPIRNTRRNHLSDPPVKPTLWTHPSNSLLRTIRQNRASAMTLVMTMMMTVNES